MLRMSWKNEELEVGWYGSLMQKKRVKVVQFLDFESLSSKPEYFGKAVIRERRAGYD